DHTPRSFASFRVAAKRVVVDALLNLEGTNRFGGVGGFVNVSRHRDNLLVNGLGAFLFGKRKILHRRITLGNERLISAESCEGSNERVWATSEFQLGRGRLGGLYDFGSDVLVIRHNQIASLSRSSSMKSSTSSG